MVLLPPPQRCGKWITLENEPRSPESLRMQLLRARQDNADVRNNGVWVNSVLKSDAPDCTLN